MSDDSHSRHPAAARKQPTQPRSRRTVERILDAAARIFAEHGYRAATTNHIADEAGVSIGSLYQYFPNKDSLLVALEERHLAEVEVVLRDAAARWRREDPGPAAWARQLVDVLIAANDTPLHVLIYDTAPPLPHLQQLTAAVVGDLTAEAAHHLRRWGVRRGAGRRAEVIVATALRLVHDVAIRTPPGPRRDQLRREIVRVLALAATPG